MLTDTIPRGVRNNNPGNIDRNGIVWLGLAANQNDARFCVFQSPLYGLRAIAKVLLTYSRKDGLHTIEGVIDRWAPAIENQTKAYADAVAADVGVDERAIENFDDPAFLAAMIKAIVHHECGEQPYDDMTIEKATLMALAA